MTCERRDVALSDACRLPHAVPLTARQTAAAALVCREEGDAAAGDDGR